MNTHFDLKETSLCLNSANQWIETWRGAIKKDQVDLYRQEIQNSLTLALTHLFGRNKPPLREDLALLISSASSLDEYTFVIHRFMEVFCYFIAVSQDRYIAVHKGDYRYWRKEEDAVRDHDPSDLIFL